MIKRPFIVPVAAMAVIALMGAGCSGSSSSDMSATTNTAAYEPSTYMPTQTGAQTPTQASNTNWIQMFYAADAGSCDGVKNFFASDVRATLTDADCTAIFAYFKQTDLSKIVTINWDGAAASADGKIVTVPQANGTTYLTYTLGADGTWYLSTKFW